MIDIVPRKNGLAFITGVFKQDVVFQQFMHIQCSEQDRLFDMLLLFQCSLECQEL